MGCFQKYKIWGPWTPHFLIIGVKFQTLDAYTSTPKRYRITILVSKNAETKAELKFQNSGTWGPHLILGEFNPLFFARQTLEAEFSKSRVIFSFKLCIPTDFSSYFATKKKLRSPTFLARMPTTKLRMLLSNFFVNL